MAIVTLVPDGDGTTLQLIPTGGGSHWDQVEEGVPGDDGATTLSTTNNSPRADFLTLGETPSDFDVAISVVARMRTQVAGIVDDNITMQCQVSASDEIALQGNQAFLVGNHSWTTTASTSATNTDNKATWDTYKIRASVNRSNSGMPDSITSEFTAVEATVNYDVVAAVDDPGFGRPFGHVGATQMQQILAR